MTAVRRFRRASIWSAARVSACSSSPDFSPTSARRTTISLKRFGWSASAAANAPPRNTASLTRCHIRFARGAIACSCTVARAFSRVTPLRSIDASWRMPISTSNPETGLSQAGCHRGGSSRTAAASRTSSTSSFSPRRRCRSSSCVSASRENVCWTPAESRAVTSNRIRHLSLSGFRPRR